MSFEKNQVVQFHYTVRNSKDEVVDDSRGGEPLAILAGNGQILPKLEEALQEMQLNEKKSVFLAAADAYGEHSDDAIQVASRDNFPKDAKLEVGMEFMASMQDGQNMPFTISKIEGEQITVDFNHPLAGEDLTFDVELTEIRDASAEELQHGHVHGAGGHHHH